MDKVLDWLFGTAQFIPHGVCLLWRPDLVALHVVSDLLIAAAYFAIPVAIYAFVRGRTDLAPEHKRMAIMFSLFIAACGFTHLGSVWTLWQPLYGTHGLVKAGTALVSVITAFGLPPLVPKLIKLPSPSLLQAANAKLEEEIGAHRLTLGELEAHRRGLEEAIAERTEDLRIVNQRFEAAIANSSVTVFEHDEALRYTWIRNPPMADESAFLGRTDAEVFPEEAARELQAVKQEALAAEGPVRRVTPITLGEDVRWYDWKSERVRLRDGRPGLICAAADITAQKAQQAHLELLMRELNHRSKNLLTIVLGIARQSAAGLDVPQDYLLRLSARLRALAGAHDLLVRHDWRSVDLRAVIEGQLEHQLQAHAGGCGWRAGRSRSSPSGRTIWPWRSTSWAPTP